MSTGIRFQRYVTRLFVPALAIVSVLGVEEAAQAACYASGQQLPAHVVSQFMSQPGNLLTQFPSGGPQMISAIRDLIASDPGTLLLIIELNTKANADQVQAIGTGLGQAALVCARPARAFSDEIQRVTIAANNKALTQAYGAVTGNQFFGLASPAGGGGSAESTGQTGSAAGTTQSSAPLSLTTSVSNTAATNTAATTSTATSVGFTPSVAAAVGLGSAGASTSAQSAGSSTPPVTASVSASVGSGGVSASVGTGGVSASVGTGGVSASVRSAGVSASVESTGVSASVKSAVSSLSAGTRTGSLFTVSSNNSVGSSVLGTTNTANITASVIANVNSATSVSPSRPR